MKYSLRSAIDERARQVGITLSNRRPFFQAGEATITRIKGKACVVICDYTNRLLLGDGSFEFALELKGAAIEGINVAVLELLSNVHSGGKEQLYHGYVNELEESVLESLGTMNKLTVIFVNQEYLRLGETTYPNPLKELARKFLRTISKLTEKQPWQPAHFAAAVAYIAAKDD